uniref:UDP-glucuronosyltransferase n=1 Tax=Gadus morhua TaxID=8049 RepID=A0A8C5FR93_GADMO
MPTILFKNVALIPLLFTTPSDGGKVLVYPVDGSHWINMKIVIEELHTRGHSIDVIRASDSWYIREESPLYSSITIPVETPVENFFLIYLDNFMKRERASAFTNLKLIWQFMSMISKAHSMNCDILGRILDDESLVQRLSDAQYDLVLTDPAFATGVVLAKYLKLPLVLNVRWITSGDGQFAIAPSPLSYIPVPGSGLTDKMSFTERTQNMLFHSLVVFQERFMVGPSYHAICDKYIEGGCDIISLIQEADIWLFRSDFVFDFPRPTMPNVVYIGGFQCKPAQPLPSGLEEFVQSAGEHGVIIMTLGTLVNALPDDIAEEIASVFAKMPQKVIWRNIGKRPSTLGNNTLIVDWMPQKDLLGHPQTKVFVAHGGTNGVQEAIYYGVPVLGIPLFFDQYDNLLRLQERGAGKILKLAEVNGRTFEQGLGEVLHQDSYRNNMQRLSQYVMRHKGAPHLRTESYRMPWYSYYSIDVMMTLSAAVTIFLLSIVIMFRFLCCRGRRISKSKIH